MLVSCTLYHTKITSASCIVITRPESSSVGVVRKEIQKAGSYIPETKSALVDFVCEKCPSHGRVGFEKFKQALSGQFSGLP